MTLSPVRPDERIDILDALRGFALLGIVLSNMPLYVNPITAHAEGVGALDETVTVFVQFFVQGKFYALFSLLFGIGFAVQMERAAVRGAASGRLYARRLLVLAGFGAAHILLVWPGDILLTYALLGFALFAFRDRAPRTLIAWAVAIVVVPQLITLATTVIAPVGAAAAAAAGEHQHALAAHAWQVYGHGSFLDVTRQRADDFVQMLPALRFMASGILGMFLVGMWVARRRLAHDVAGHRALLIRIVAVCAPLGAVANGLLVLARSQVGGGDPMWRFVIRAAVTVGGPLSCFAYASGLALLATGERWRRWMAPLRAAGKMALTNYLMQSIVCTTLFYGYGAGLLGRVTIAGGALLGVALWAAQLAASTLWLRRYQYGPAEWLWRSLTYLRRPPMRRA